MTTSGLRPRAELPARYRGFHLVRSHGRVYGIPPFLDVNDFLTHRQPFSHPALLSAASYRDLQALIDRCPPERGAEAPAQEPTDPAAVPVDLAAWLPVFDAAGYSPDHPHFEHISCPPPGYRFTASWPRDRPQPLPRPGRCTRLLMWLGRAARQAFARPADGMAPSAGARLRTFLACVRLLVHLLRRGASFRAAIRFLATRDYPSQVQLARAPGLVFLTSMPYTYGQNPWVVEIEDPTTLFYPLIENGTTCDLRIQESPYYPVVKTLLESDHCRGILTHLKSTAAMLPALFRSETIRAKVHYTPLGVRLPERWQRHEGPAEGEPLHLLFINSWCQVADNFYVRGGLDVLEAFAVLRQRYPQLRLTLRTGLPALDGHYHRILEGGGIRVISRFLPAEEMESLFAESHIFLLPAARIHVVSLLQAMSYGLAVVTSDGWGISEYVTHDRNGVIVPGRYGKVSWADEEAGMLREDYGLMHTPDPEVVRGLVEAVSRLVEDRAYRRRLGQTARRDVETTYNLERWNQGLRAALERAAAG